MELETAIRRRHSIRSYSSKAVSWERIVKVLDSARLAPFAGNLCTIKLILVSDREKIRELSEAAWEKFILNAPAVIVVCSDDSISIQRYGKRGVKYARQQAGAAIQNMLLIITNLGLASCWIGAFDDNRIRSILGIPHDTEVEAILPLAHKSFIRESKVSKIPLNNILYFERYGRRERKPTKMAR